MPEQRRRFSPQFKAEAVQMVIETGKPIAEVARELGIHDGTLGNWVNAWRREHPEPDQPLTPSGACPRAGNGRRDPPAADGERVSEKSRGLLRPDAPVAVRCALIDAEKANYPVMWMCRLLGVPRSSFYAWRAGSRRPTAVRRRELAGACAAGLRRLPRRLRLPAGCCRAQPGRPRVQRRAGCRADARTRPRARASPRAYKRTTLPGAQPVASPDLIGRDFTAARRAPGWSATSPTSRPARAGCI